MNSLNIVIHPLAKYWLTKLRDKNSPAFLFRQACTSLSSILVYEALRNVLISDVTIDTPFVPMKSFSIGQKICFVPIMRTGNLLLEGAIQMYPEAQVSPIGLRRGQDGTIIEYDIELLFPSDDRLFCVIVDGIVDTGKTLCKALDLCKRSWPKAKFSTISFIGLKTGFDFIMDQHPDVSVWALAIDKGKNSQGYMLPGIGDMKYRAYNTDNQLIK